MKNIKALDEFKQGKNNIGFVSSSFISEFGNNEIEKGSVIPFQILKKMMTDSEIIKELGVKECTLGDVLETLKSAPKEIKDGYWNIFYIKGHSRVVSVYWFSSSWHVSTWRRGGRWGEGSRVFLPQMKF